MSSNSSSNNQPKISPIDDDDDDVLNLAHDLKSTYISTPNNTSKLGYSFSSSHLPNLMHSNSFVNPNTTFKSLSSCSSITDTSLLHQGSSVNSLAPGPFSLPPLPNLSSSPLNSNNFYANNQIPLSHPKGLARSFSAIHVPNMSNSIPVQTRSPPLHPTAYHRQSSPAISSLLHQQVDPGCATDLDISAILWDTLSASNYPDQNAVTPPVDLFTRDFYRVLALYRQLSLEAPSTLAQACILSIAVSNSCLSQLKFLSTLIPHDAHFIDSVNLALVTELLRLVLLGVRHFTVISNCLAIHQSLKFISETHIIRVHWVTSLPYHSMTDLSAVRFSSLDDFMTNASHQSLLSRTFSESHVPPAVSKSTLNVIQQPNSSSPLSAFANQSYSYSPLRGSHSALNLSTLSSPSTYYPAPAAAHRTGSGKSLAQPVPLINTRRTSPPLVTSQPSSYMNSHQPITPPRTSPHGVGSHPHPPNIVKSVPLRPPPDPDYIPIRHVSFGPLYHALHHPAIRDRLGPHYSYPIDLSLLGGILKQAMDPFASLKLYLQAAAECGLLRLGHMGSRCLLKVVNPVWLAYWEPYSKDSVLVPNAVVPHPMSSTSSSYPATDQYQSFNAADKSPVPPEHLSETELGSFLPLLHAFCIARMRYPVPIRTPAIGPLLKPMFARGELAPWRKLSEYLAEAQRRGAITLTRLGVNGDVEIAIRTGACGDVWQSVRAKYGAFRDPIPVPGPHYVGPQDEYGSSPHVVVQPPYAASYPVLYPDPPVHYAKPYDSTYHSSVNLYNASTHACPPVYHNFPQMESKTPLSAASYQPVVAPPLADPQPVQSEEPAVVPSLPADAKVASSSDDEEEDPGLTFIVRTSSRTSPVAQDDGECTGEVPVPSISGSPESAE